MYLGIGLTLGAIAYAIPTSTWRVVSPWLLLLAFAFLVLVLVPGVGRVVNGSQRWIPLGPLTFQPSEFAKFALVVWLSGYMVRHAVELRTELRGLLKPIGVLLIFAVLLLLEPDFGATVIVLGTAFGMLFMAGARLVYVLALVLSAIAIIIGSFQTRGMAELFLEDNGLDCKITFIEDLDTYRVVFSSHASLIEARKAKEEAQSITENAWIAVH